MIHSHDPARLYVHVPTPGDHYSPATGSAIMTAIYELSREHAAAGGESRIVVGRGTRHDYPVGDCVEVDFGTLRGRRQKVTDAALGAVGVRRRFAAAAFEPALAAVEQDFEGPVLIYNGPGAVPEFKRQRPRARCGLYARNTLFRTYTRRELRRTLGSADFVLCLSHFLAEDLAARWGGRADNVHVVPNGVDLERFRPDARTAAADEPVVLFVGRVHPEKGVHILLRAAAKLYGAGRRFRVRIVGSRGFSAADPLSRYERKLRELARPLGAAVEFQPFVDRARIVSCYQSASIFCAPSNCDDACPQTVSEAMACGLPSVAARRGGIPEIGGDSVLYFRPPSVDELAERLAHLIDDESARTEWGRRARERACERSWARQYAKLRAAVEG